MYWTLMLFNLVLVPATASFLCTKKKTETTTSELAPHAVELCAPLSPQREVSFHNVAGLSAQFSKWAEACTVRYSISVSPPTLR